jgi:hypothetical protein
MRKTLQKTFKQSLVDHLQASPSLPLMHTTSVPRFEGIGDEDRLRPQKCNIYTKESLIYFFYGKPSFRPRGEDTTHRNMIQFAPVCLVLKSDVGLSPKRVLPFDSGAYHLGIMTREGHAHHDLQKERFELGDQHDAEKVVGLYFGSNLNYVDEIANMSSQVDVKSNICVETYVSLISRTGTNQGDSRLNTIEIQFNQEIVLLGNVLAVALPSPLYDRPEIKEKLVDWSAEPLLYEINGSYTPGGCCQMIN